MSEAIISGVSGVPGVPGVPGEAGVSGVEAAQPAPSLLLEQSRAQFRRALASNLSNSLIGLWWSSAERAMARLTGRRPPLPFTLVVVGVSVLALLTSYAVSLLLGESAITQPAYLLSRVMWAAFTVVYILVVNAQLEHAVQVVSTTITENIPAPDDLAALQDLIRKGMRRRWQFLFSLCFALFAGAWVPSMLSEYGGPSVPVGAVVLHVLNYFQIGMYIYFLLVVISVLLGLSGLELDIYPNDPSNSQVIRSIYHVCSALTVSVAALGAVQYFLMTVSRVDLSVPLALTGLIMLGLLPPLALFFTIHWSLARIMVKAKGRKLAQIQATIRQAESSDDATANPQPAKEQLELLQMLMDYHDRIKSTPNSMINFSSLANLFASLLLPLLATILSNIPIMLELFAPGR